jgi:hypothetical protein
MPLRVRSTAAERNPRAVLLDFTSVCISITGEMLGARAAGFLRTMALAADATPRLRNRLALRIPEQLVSRGQCSAAPLGLSWSTTTAIRRIPVIKRVIGERQVCWDQRGSARSWS